VLTVNALLSASADSQTAVGENLARALDLLDRQPGAALELATKALEVVRDHPAAMLICGIAQRLSGNAADAVTTLERLTYLQPHAAVAHYEYGLALARVGRGDAAIAALRCAVALDPSIPGAWGVLADHLTAIGDVAGADSAYLQHIKSASRNPRLMRAAAALCENQIPTAEATLRAHLRDHPTDVAAIRMFAEVAARVGRLAEAESLLARALELAPGFHEARAHYAIVLQRQNRPLEALEHVDRLLKEQRASPNHRNLKASILVAIGEYGQAIDLFASLLEEYPAQARVWLSYGHVLKTAGRRAESIRAYRRCLELVPSFGEAWFTLANLKTFEFTAEDMAAMRAALARSDASDDDRLHLHFALGKACEDASQFELSFLHYAEGNRLRRVRTRYRSDETTKLVERSRALFTREFFAARAGAGSPAPDPIFIVGLPRAGSTLVDQILSSHSLVEGTMELHDIIDLSRSVNTPAAQGERGHYPQVLAALSPERLRELGEQYLRRTRVQRKTGAPYFIDKMPNNFLHLGLILLALPNARIIDVRRNPLACCFSVFKQHFARGQHFSYDLADIGRYYNDYLDMMAHFDAVLPGRVHRVSYESLVENTEAEVRALLEYCALPFEERCLRFYENERAVRTASSEQVRKPIFRDGLEQWRNYEPWLEPLKKVLDARPSVTT
jgi:predicted Zn-dependent protease